MNTHASFHPVVHRSKHPDIMRSKKLKLLQRLCFEFHECGQFINPGELKKGDLIILFPPIFQADTLLTAYRHSIHHAHVIQEDAEGLFYMYQPKSGSDFIRISCHELLYSSYQKYTPEMEPLLSLFTTKISPYHFSSPTPSQFL